MEISKMLTVSTAHITEGTAELLDNDRLDIIVYPKDEYGWFITFEENIANCYNSDKNKSNYSYVPKDLLKLLMFAKDLGCDWLCLDRDGDILDYLDTYDW